MSGKAMSVPPAGTVREVTRRIEESEGHVARVCGLFISQSRSICRAKVGVPVVRITGNDKSMNVNDLVRTGRFGQEDPWKFEGKAKCRTMHTRCTNSKRNEGNKPMAADG